MMKIKPSKNIHITRDIAEAASIETVRRITPTLRAEGNIVWFVFDRCPDAKAISELYWGVGLEVDARVFAHVLRELKNRVFATLRKDEDENGIGRRRY